MRTRLSAAREGPNPSSLIRSYTKWSIRFRAQSPDLSGRFFFSTGWNDQNFLPSSKSIEWTDSFSSPKTTPIAQTEQTNSNLLEAAMVF